MSSLILHKADQLKSVRFGVVIGTYGYANSYIRLQLIKHRERYGKTPIMVHDDCSPEINELIKVCEEFNATLMSTNTRLGHERGDIAAFIAGANWARENNIKFFLKLSVRYLPIIDIRQYFITNDAFKVAHWRRNGYRTDFIILETDKCFDYNMESYLETHYKKQKKKIVETLFRDWIDSTKLPKFIIQREDYFKVIRYNDRRYIEIGKQYGIDFNFLNDRRPIN